MIKYIVKRNNSKVAFDATKISSAMKKALDAVKADYLASELKQMEYDAVDLLLRRYVTEDDTVTVEEAQDVAEDVLARHGYTDAMRAFDRYRVNHEQIRQLTSEADDQVANFAERVISSSLGKFDATEAADPCKELDVIHNQNASTAGGTIGASILQTSEAMSKLYWKQQYDEQINDYSQVGSKNYFYIHDMGMVAGYCAGWSLKDLLLRGLSGVANKISSAPPKHLVTVVTQLTNFLGIMQNEWAGAQAVSSFDTYLAPFVKTDNLSYESVKQCIQIFVFGVNVSSRWGSQSPFSNITLDWTCPDDMKQQPAIVGGKEQSFTYGDCQKEMDMINKAFLEVMIAGDSDGRGFQYPIPTYSITREFDWSDTENNRLLFEMAAKYGTPYFSNYINSDMNPSDVRSMCCRLRLDLRELRKQNGGNFGAGENTGSIGVVTIDLPQIAYLSEDENDFFARLEDVMNVAARSLDIKRKVVDYYMAHGAYPYTSAYLDAGLKNHFSTIGLVGMNEACLNANWIRADLTQQKSLDWAGKVLDFMRNKLSDYQELYGCLFNLEATPAESTCYTLARKDKERYPGIITAGTNKGETPYYTNSSHLPVGAIDDIYDALDKEDNLQTKYTSGTVFHAFLGERLSSWEQAAAIVKSIAENYQLPYFTLSPTYSVCEDHGYIQGEVKACPHCGKPTEIYSRITGYYRPVSNWNAGKSQEFEDRHTYNMTKMVPKTASKDVYSEIEQAFDESVSEEVSADVTILSTHTCPKCKMAKKMMDDKGVTYASLYAEDEDGRRLAEDHNIVSVPAMFFRNGDSVEVVNDFNQILTKIKAM